MEINIPDPALSIEASVGQVGLCDDLAFEAEALIEGPEFSVDWFLNGENFSQEPSAEGTVDSPGTFEFVVTATDLICLDTYADTVLVEFIDGFDINLPSNLNLCYNESSVEIDATVNFDEVEYDWNDGLSGQPILEVSEEGVYFVEVSQIQGCTEIDETDVNFISELPLFFEKEICAGQENQIELSLFTELIENVVWENGDVGFTTSVQSPGYISFVATDIFGCLQTDSALARPIERFIIDEDIPNVITPNGDGRNDFFIVPLEGLVYLEVLIYDRWGRLIFESNNPEIKWDGTNQKNAGGELIESTYMYVIRYRDECDVVPKEITGNVEILR